MNENAAPLAGHFHAVKFYESPQSMCSAIAKFVGEGLVEQQPALIIAMPEDHAGILSALGNGYIDVARATAAGDFWLLDASDLLRRVMVDGMPDAISFTTLTTAILDQVLRGRKECLVRVYGGMVAYLWTTGNVAAALAVERLWNVLALTHPFSLLCGYPIGPYDTPADAVSICRQHSHVVIPRAPLWMTDGPGCPSCGTSLPPWPRTDVVYRCEACGVELIDYSDAHQFVVDHLQARNPTT